VRALRHALDTQRLHHAYLLTGTRGVGKTTLARILARSVNCETGVSSTPCGHCGPCVEIDAGSFVDYIELDAASNRGVDEMAQLLGDAVYAPTAGRYKVYVIDEVHMLSTHAFNAMLKTLEEPPPHVLFVLATTDAHKVPATVLSRCLQLNLRNLPAPRIAAHLAEVLAQENVASEPAALAALGRAAAGSMRDGLSLLEQAIASGAGSVGVAAVQEMLGVVERGDLLRIVAALIAGEAGELVAIADEMVLANSPFERTLLDFAALMQRLALAQAGVTSDDDADLAEFARLISPADVQVYYQIAIHGARDLALAPDPQTGFTMVLLRLLAFAPGRVPAASAPRAAPAAPRTTPARAEASTRRAAATVAAPAPPPRATTAPLSAANQAANQAANPKVGTTPRDPAAPAEVGAAGAAIGADRQAAQVSFDGNWPGLAVALPVRGMVDQFMRQSELLDYDGDHFRLRVPVRMMAERAMLAKVREALSAHFGRTIRISVEVGAVGEETAEAVARRANAERLERASATLEADPAVRSLLDEFDGVIVPGSVRALEPKGNDGGEQQDA